MAAGVIARIMGASARHPWTVLGIMAGLVALAGLAATRLTVETDSSRMIAPHLPAQQQAHALNAAFPWLKTAVLVVVRAERADDADRAVSTLADSLATQPSIGEIFAPAIDPFLAGHGFLYESPEAVEKRFSRLSQSANLLARVRSDPTLAGWLGAIEAARGLVSRADLPGDVLSALEAETAAVLDAARRGTPRDLSWAALMGDGASVTRVLSVQPVADPGRLNPARPALDAIRGQIASLPEEVRAGVWLGVTGEPALRAEEQASVTRTIGLSLAVSLVLVTLVLWRGLGSGARLGAALIALGVTLVLSTGFAAVAAAPLNLISIAFIVLMVGLGIDFAIHVLLHLGEQDGPPEAAARATGRGAGLALGLSAVTTAAAFFSFVPTDFAGMAQLGIIGGAGVLIAFAVALTVLPALAALWPGLGRRPVAATTGQAPGWLAWVALGTGALALPFALQARFDADPMGLRDPGAPSVLAFAELAADPDTSPYRASVLVPDAAAAARVKDRLDGVAEVHAVRTLAGLIPADQDLKLDLLDLAAPSIEHALTGQPEALVADAGGPLAARIARLEGAPGPLGLALGAYAQARTAAMDADVAVRLFAHFPRLEARLAAMLDADRVTQDALPPPLLRRFLADDGRERVEIVPAGGPGPFADTLARILPEAAGGPVQLAAAGQTVSRAMVQATALAACLTALFAFAATRRMGDTLAVLAPLTLAGTLTAAFSHLADVPFNYANVIVLPLMIGIGVDSSVHLALRARQSGAVFATSTPRAVLVSALTTLVAFATLALSDHRGTASMGLLLAVGLLATLGAVFALTPALIRWTGR